MAARNFVKGCAEIDDWECLGDDRAYGACGDRVRHHGEQMFAGGTTCHHAPHAGGTLCGREILRRQAA
jgi:hypothetical protein